MYVRFIIRFSISTRNNEDFIMDIQRYIPTDQLNERFYYMDQLTSLRLEKLITSEEELRILTLLYSKLDEDYVVAKELIKAKIITS